jgi:pantoate--beta-alanine ligase
MGCTGRGNRVTRSGREVKIVRRIAELRELLASQRAADRTIGFVPTMGAFHDGHLSLMRRARIDCDVVVVSLFVNPTQFNDTRDLDAYPREEKRDAGMASAERVDILFAPSAVEMYPHGFATTVSVGGVSEPLEGAARGPAHFAGVATVVVKLFNIVQPTAAYFGQKDAQQALVVRKLVRDLDFRIRIEVCPTVREADGLAMSSRNIRLSPEDRHRALALRAGLDAAVAAIESGERRSSKVEQLGRDAMRARNVEPEYFAAVAADSVLPFDTLQGDILLAVAARVGDVRLIDNELVHIR